MGDRMIIWGWKYVTSTRATGRFDCPDCGPDRKYIKKRQQRYFTLYFIPIIPLKEINEYIECQFCTKTWDEGVLEYKAPPSKEAVEAKYREVLCRLLGRAAAIDGGLDSDRHAKAEAELKATLGADADLAAFNALPTEAAPPEELAAIAAELGQLCGDAIKEEIFGSVHRII